MTAKLLVGSCVVFGAVTALTMACNSDGSHGSGVLGSGGGSAGGGKNAGAGAGMVASARADEGGTRLRANAITGTDGSKHYVGTFRDSMRNEDCTFTALADGSLRCLPPIVAQPMDEVVYSDAECTKPLVAFSEDCTTAPKYLGVGDKCGHINTVYERGARHPGTIWVKHESCSNYGDADQTYFEAGAPVDLASFVGGSLAPE